MSTAVFLDEPIPNLIEQWRHYFRLLDPKSGDSILDVGSGSGDPWRLLMRDHPAIGMAQGLEPAEQLLGYSQEAWKRDGSPPNLAFQQGEVHDLAFDDDSFNRLICAESVEYFGNPSLAFSEIRRVLKSGGVALITHTDFDTAVYNSADNHLNRKVALAFSDSGPGGQFGRQLYGICSKAGFSHVHPSVYVVTNTEWSEDRYGYQLAQMIVHWLKEKDVFQEDLLTTWLESLEMAAASDECFFSINRIVCKWEN